MTTAKHISTRALALVILVSCVLFAISSSFADKAPRDASPYHGPVYKRQGNQGNDNGITSISDILDPPGGSSSPSGGQESSTSTSTSSSSIPTSSSSSTVSSSSSTTPSTTESSTSSSSTSTQQTQTSQSSTVATTSSTSTSATSTKATATSVQNTSVVVNSRSGVTIENTADFRTTSYKPTQTANVGDNSQTDSADDSEATQSSGNTDFMSNKGAVAATFTVVALVGAGLVVFAGLFIRKRMRDRYIDKSDWDEVGVHGDSASMAEFTSGHGHGGVGTTAILPSAALARQPSSRGHDVDEPHHDDRPDSMLAMPPVMNYERPRDSAFDIVPAGPPSLAVPQLREPGNTTSFGSGMGGDPFAGGPPMPWQEAQRDSAFGPGQAGRGAGTNMGGYAMQPYSGGNGNDDAYGGAYTGQPASGYQYSYPSHAYGQQYAGNAQAGGNGGYGYGM